jgi:hypothetical protein
VLSGRAVLFGDNRLAGVARFAKPQKDALDQRTSPIGYRGKVNPAAPGKAVAKYKVHWHVAFTHFPVSFFMISLGFMLCHLFARAACFELASYLTLITGAIVMVPTTLTGWFTWKDRYKGFRGRIFLNKIRIAFFMLGLSFLLVIYRTLFKIEFMDILHNAWHAVYFIGILLLVAGAISEGSYGGRLNHS